MSSGLRRDSAGLPGARVRLLTAPDSNCAEVYRATGPSVRDSDWHLASFFSLSRALKYNARNFAALNWLRMIYCAEPVSCVCVSDGQLSSGGLDFTSSGCTLLAQPGVLRFSILITTSQSNAQSSGDGSVLEVAEGAPLVVQCSLRPHQPLQWFLNGSTLPDAMRIAAMQHEDTAASDSEVVSRLEWGAAAPHHAGRYTCTQGSDAPYTLVRVLPRSRSRTRTGTDRRPSYPFGSVS
ncbi:hypothetical protein EVAR_91812_1 [Eumeta japonica]|uniref:Ig-like domain-containing protein n=1 Tax=Eumeta variegata TaxID=151549 RepID=A0A4C1SUC9_EUMVA|nr:hypothetical protein EVAR_91812_1 [Eumeta japonica]